MPVLSRCFGSVVIITFWKESKEWTKATKRRQNRKAARLRTDYLLLLLRAQLKTGDAQEREECGEECAVCSDFKPDYREMEGGRPVWWIVFSVYSVCMARLVRVTYLGRIWQLDAPWGEGEPAGAVWRFGRSAGNPCFHSFLWTYVQSRALICGVLAVSMCRGWFSTSSTPNISSICVKLRAFYMQSSWIVLTSKTNLL